MTPDKPRRHPSKDTEEYKRKQREYNRARRAAMTPEERDSYNALRREQARQRHAADRSWNVQRTRAWANANPGQKRISAKVSYDKHADRRRSEALARYHANRDVILARRRAWRDANPEKIQARNAQRRKHGTGALKSGEWAAILADFNNACAYCHQQMDRLEFEHMTPISRGGITVRDNIVPACPTCNRRKKTRNILEFWPFAN